MPNWLPDLLFLQSYNGDWGRYFDVIYNVFESDFVLDKPVFRGRRLGLKRHPEYDGKSATFWHMISEGKVEENRAPDLRRCERIRWPRPIIDNDRHPSLKIWAEERGSNTKRIHIWYEEEGYLVVLDDRGSYVLPWTAYYIEHAHQRKKMQKRWEKYGPY